MKKVGFYENIRRNVKSILKKQHVKFLNGTNVPDIEIANLTILRENEQQKGIKICGLQITGKIMKLLTVQTGKN
ncbi:hypothetical protein FAEUMB_04840 [Faecalimonas umbilicata]|uniref:Uncharacterized protein n=1 Tax=Faecalimonas umbilicata TaxID=1912855 RepID=A0ABQ0QU54_9FIRM|nr:hypothetical protein FAEUMB_04840 [Faecalimonas umbilicata]